MFHGHGPPHSELLQHTTFTVTFSGPVRPTTTSVFPRSCSPVQSLAVAQSQISASRVKVSGPHWLHSLLRNHLSLSLSGIVNCHCHPPLLHHSTISSPLFSSLDISQQASLGRGQQSKQTEISILPSVVVAVIVLQSFQDICCLGLTMTLTQLLLWKLRNHRYHVKTNI